MFLRKQSISRDLTVALVLVVLGVCCLVIAVNFAISSRKIQSELEQKAEEIVSYLAKTLEMPLWHIDKEGIRKIGNLYASNELISELRITDESTGQILYTHQPSAEKELVEKSRKILHDGELIGSLLIGLKPDNYRQSNQRLLRTSILIMLASIITVILAAGVLLRFFLERPFNDLITGLDRIAAGDYKYRFETWKKREIRAIISKFNHMAEQVRVRQRSLHKINQRLQKEIAEHKESEQALRKSEEKYRSILETIEDGYYEIDLDSTFRFGNESLAGIYGCSEQELLGRKMRDFTDDETATMGYRHFNEVYRTGIPKIGFSWEIITKNGGRRHVETSISLIKDTDGKAVGFRGIMRDVTDRLLSEKALRENEGRLRAIFEANPDPVVVYDRQGRPQYLNPAFTQVFGWSLGELLGKRIPFVPDDQEAISSAKISELYESGQPIRVETKRFTKDGRILDILVSAAMIKGSEGEPSGMVVNLTDITERKKLEAQFQAAQRMESLGTLAGGIAHNFNNLLMAILGNASFTKNIKMISGL